jgi:hypothetical protein
VCGRYGQLADEHFLAISESLAAFDAASAHQNFVDLGGEGAEDAGDAFVLNVEKRIQRRTIALGPSNAPICRIQKLIGYANLMAFAPQVATEQIADVELSGVMNFITGFAGGAS